MSTATTQQQMPVVPPRPAKNQEQTSNGALQPKIPPRPLKKRGDRSVSPGHDRFAPSPLSGGFLSNAPPESSRFSPRKSIHEEPFDRSKSVDLPTLGEEGNEYAAYNPAPAILGGAAKEPTITVANDLHLHAPKPSLPAKSAKDRVMGVTRTDSDKAASFGIGKPGSRDDSHDGIPRSLKAKASTVSELSTDHSDDEQGIPEIGQQVPMYPNAGDVQAPSPAPSYNSFLSNAGPKSPNHKRKSSSRGLPPGSYGLHGHGVESHDKLEQSYYQKHPELLKLEHHIYQPDRATDHSMSSEDLNRIVHNSARADAAAHRYVGTPSEQVGWLALNESTSRPQSTKPHEPSHLRHASQPDISSPLANGETIHVDEPNQMRHLYVAGDPVPAPVPEETPSYSAPIFASDEIRKDTPVLHDQPAMQPPPERRGSAFEMEPPHSRPTSRPTSRPASIYKVESHEQRSRQLEDVEEYEPLFSDEDGKKGDKILNAAKVKDLKQRFPSRDIWEDAPVSAQYTTEVNTPDMIRAAQEAKDAHEAPRAIPPRTTETPAQAFARRQEELAEQESHNPDSFMNPLQKVPSHQGVKNPIIAHQKHLVDEVSRPKAMHRFPSQDIWEDTPDSLQLQTTVSNEQVPLATSPTKTKSSLLPQRKATDPADKPTIPERPKAKSSDDAAKPAVSDRPKPQVPARPAKSVSGSSADNNREAAEPSAAKAKPPVPSRPMGSKIAALQAGFMSDLNKKLGLGPKAPKKEEPPEEIAEEPKEKAPLADARKGRARGPQRRAPALASATSNGSAGSNGEDGGKLKLTFSNTITVYSIDPEDGSVEASEIADEGADREDTQATNHSVHAQKVEEPETNDIAPPAVEPTVEREEAPALHRVQESTEASKPDTESAVGSKPAELDPEAEAPKHGHVEVETKTNTLATNTAGETVASTKTADTEGQEQVEAVAGTTQSHGEDLEKAT